jgi:hypothetical protein
LTQDETTKGRLPRGGLFRGLSGDAAVMLVMMISEIHRLPGAIGDQAPDRAAVAAQLLRNDIHADEIVVVPTSGRSGAIADATAPFKNQLGLEKLEIAALGHPQAVDDESLQARMIAREVCRILFHGENPPWLSLVTAGN